MNRLNILLAALFCTCHLAAQVNLNSSLTACYALDGNASEPINSFTGTLSSVTSTVGHTGQANTALYFSGQISSYVQLPNNTLLKPNQISFSAWVRATAIAQNQMIVFTKNPYSNYHTAYALAIFGSASGPKFVISRQNGTSTDLVYSTTTVVANTWYHVAFSLDNTQGTIYVNGVMENSQAPVITSFYYDPSKPVILGGINEPTGGPYVYQGFIDNVRFYNRILSAQEVSAIYADDPSCIISATGINEYGNGHFNPVIYPNPTAGSFEIYGIEGLPCVIRIADVMGKEVYAATGSEARHVIDGLSNGIYFVRIGDGKESRVLKLLKE